VAEQLEQRLVQRQALQRAGALALDGAQRGADLRLLPLADDLAAAGFGGPALCYVAERLLRVSLGRLLG
jgi:hypothetical protein